MCITIMQINPKLLSDIIKNFILISYHLTTFLNFSLYLTRKEKFFKFILLIDLFPNWLYFQRNARLSQDKNRKWKEKQEESYNKILAKESCKRVPTCPWPHTLKRTVLCFLVGSLYLSLYYTKRFKKIVFLLRHSTNIFNKFNTYFSCQHIFKCSDQSSLLGMTWLK